MQRLKRGIATAAAALALATVAGCSSVRLAYDTAPTTAWWWLDGHLGFHGEQVEPAKQALQRWFGWHRSTQLRGYADWLAATRSQVGDSVTAAEVCRRWNDGWARLDPAFDEAFAVAAPLLPRLDEANFAQLDKKLARRLDELRKELAPADRAERLQAATERSIESMERVFGRLDAPQRALVAEQAKASPFDADAWLAERERRHREWAATLRRLAAERAGRAAVVAALRPLAERVSPTATAAVRASAQRVQEHQCATVARLWNALTPAQRDATRSRWAGWEADLKTLAAASPAAAAGTAAAP